MPPIFYSTDNVDHVAVADANADTDATDANDDTVCDCIGLQVSHKAKMSVNHA